MAIFIINSESDKLLAALIVEQAIDLRQVRIENIKLKVELEQIKEESRKEDQDADKL